ncbi:hypothetical protein HGRIS_000159 [Hohenbuehelia grisea]|uniref:Potassium channel domain-containing protein n=1 Tax=Hohenbuehelia grisea TaxID=104357 RepID=A0ABR3JR66_9AGAR
MFLPLLAVTQILNGPRDDRRSDLDDEAKQKRASAPGLHDAEEENGLAQEMERRDGDGTDGIENEQAHDGGDPVDSNELGFEDDELEDDPGLDEDDAEIRVQRSRLKPRRVFTVDSRTTTYSPPPTPSKSPPSWFLQVKEFLNPAQPHQDLDSYIPHYRYTPILSGVVIPFAMLLEIPGLTEHWYIRTLENKIVETQENSVLLDLGMAFSMAFGLLANICLVTRFLERRVKTMTVACILFLTMHDLINIIAVTVFGIQHRFDDGFTYGQSFWMTVCSTVASTFTNITLIIDFVRTSDFANSGSGLTRKQRSLVIIIIILLSYITLGSLVHTYLLNLTFIDALYFTVVTIETVGLGDIVPKSAGARVFVCFYAAFGVVNVALAVGLIRETVLEALEVEYRKRLKAVRARRRALHFQRRVQARWREAVEWRLRDGGHPVWVRDAHDSGGRSRLRDWLHDHWPGLAHGLGFGGDSRRSGQARLHPHGMRLNLEALTNSQLEAAAMEAGVPLSTLLPPNFRRRRSSTDSRGERDGWVPPIERNPEEIDKGVPLTHVRLGRMIAMLSKFAVAVQGSGHLAGDIPPAEQSNERDDGKRRRGDDEKSLVEQYEAFKGGIEEEERKAFYARLTVAWSLFIVFYILGSAIFTVTEGWGFGAAMYFCFMAFMTIGYGDFTPVTPAGRSVFVVWALLGIATMTILISIVSEAYSYRYKHALHKGPFEQAVRRYRAETAAQLSGTPQSQIVARHGKRPTNLRLRRAQEHPGAPPPVLSGNRVAYASPLASPASRSADGLGPAPQPADAQEAETRTQAQLEALPHRILEHARSFHEHVQYFVGGHHHAQGGSAVPAGVRKLMDDIAGAEKLGERIKEEVLQDEDARQTLFTLSIEEALRNMIKVSEEALAALKARDEAAAGQPWLNRSQPAIEETSR